jgi:hypothetical protein
VSVEWMSDAVSGGMLRAEMPSDREVMECGSEGQSM